MNKFNNLCFWSKGDVISAERLNDMTCRINFLNDKIKPSSVDTLAKDGTLNGAEGKYNRNLCKMHSEDGVGKIIDGFVQPGVCEGNYARINGVNSWGPNNATVCEGMKRIGNVECGSEIYQKITTDYKGSVTNVELYQRSSTESVPTSTLWQYSGESTSGGSCGVLYHRLSKTVHDCRVGAVKTGKSKIYTTIKTNDFFLPPIPQNAEGDKVKLIKHLDGNTIPVKTLSGGAGTTLEDCSNYVCISSGVTFATNCFTSSNHMTAPVCVKWSDNFGFKIHPNQCKNPHRFKIEPFGTPGEGGSYNAGEGIGINGSCIYNKKANSANCTLGGIYNISTSSCRTLPAICNGNVILPDYAKRDEITPPTHSVVYSSSTPSPNNCGWVMTMLLCNVAMQIPTTTCYMPMYYRQLMRFKCNNLEVSYQYKTSEGGNWQRGPLPSMASLTSMTSLS